MVVVVVVFFFYSHKLFLFVLTRGFPFLSGFCVQFVSEDGRKRCCERWVRCEIFFLADTVFSDHEFWSVSYKPHSLDMCVYSNNQVSQTGAYVTIRGQTKRVCSRK